MAVARVNFSIDSIDAVSHSSSSANSWIGIPDFSDSFRALRREVTLLFLSVQTNGPFTKSQTVSIAVLRATEYYPDRGF